MDRPAKPPRPIVAASVPSGRLPSRCSPLVLLSGPAFAACSGAHATTSTGTPASAMPTMRWPTTCRWPAPRRRWTARPAYVESNAATEEAYAFAICPSDRSSPGCRATAAARGWATAATSTATSSTGSRATRPVFEEHASFCDICVQITLKTKQLARRGQVAARHQTGDRPDVRWVRGPGHPHGPAAGLTRMPTMTHDPDRASKLSATCSPGSAPAGQGELAGGRGRARRARRVPRAAPAGPACLGPARRSGRSTRRSRCCPIRPSIGPPWLTVHRVGRGRTPDREDQAAHARTDRRRRADRAVHRGPGAGKAKPSRRAERRPRPPLRPSPRAAR